MTGSGSPCGACKFLRRKCARGCIFAPYFCHENGATHFAAIHKVFGASNVSKLLAHLPVSDRCEAAVTISYEAQARLQDPIYGCVSHIFALQQQVVSLQAQLTSLKDNQSSQSFVNGPAAVENPNENWLPELKNSSNKFPQVINIPNYHINYENGNMNSNSIGSSNSYESYDQNSGAREENVSYGSFEEVSPSMGSFDVTQTNARQYWGNFNQDVDELQSMAFGFVGQN